MRTVTHGLYWKQSRKVGMISSQHMIREVIYKNSDCQIFLFAFLYEKYLTLKSEILTAHSVDNWLLNDNFKNTLPTSNTRTMN